MNAYGTNSLCGASGEHAPQGARIQIIPLS